MGIKDNLEKAAAIFGAPSEPRCALMSEDVKEKMINEPFDITKHEFSDADITSAFITDKRDRINFNFDSDVMPTDTISFNKLDLICACKALSVTGEDLK